MNIFRNLLSHQRMRRFLFPLFAFLPLLATAATGAASIADLSVKAHSLFEAKRYPEARAVIEKIAAEDPRNAEARFYLGVLAEIRQDTDAAIAQLEQAAALAPTNSRYVLELGGAYGTAAQKAGLLSKFGLARKCRTAFEKAVALDPDNLDARNALLSYYRQAPAIVGGSMDKAYEQAEEIRRRDPGRGAAALTQLYLGERKYDQAFTAIDAGLQAMPTNYYLNYLVGVVAAESSQQLDRGEKALRYCLTLERKPYHPPYAAAHWRLGNIAEKRGQPAAARAEYETALKLDPGFKRAAASLAGLK